MFPNPFHVLPPPWGDLKLTADKEAVVVLGDQGQVHLKDLHAPVVADVAYVLGATQKSFARLCSLVNAERMDFFQMSAADLSPLAHVQNLRHLAIRWNTKLVDAAPLAQLDLVGLILEETPKLVDLSSLSALRHLEYLEFSGGMNSMNTAKTLAPLAELPNLRNLSLFSLKVDAGGITPLAHCTSLKKLEISNQFSTEEYAFLSVHLPDTECAMFKAWVARRQSDLDVMIVGSRKPFLSSAIDAGRIEKYERLFAALRERFASNKALQPDAAGAMRSRRG